MITALLLAAAAATPTAVDAERAFARDAQRLGQWTAFAKYAAPDAVMFDPQAVWARDFLKGRKNPPKSVRWWPVHSFLSCDGRTAVNTGPWVGPDGKTHGNFATVWQRTGRQWRWVYDGGEAQDGPVPAVAKPQTHRAACRGKAPGAPVIPPPSLTAKQARTTPEDSGRGESSADKTLGWDWKVEKDGTRRFRVFAWNGLRYAQVLAKRARSARMIELFGSALVTFLVIIDPPGCAPIFASLTRGTSLAHRRSMAVRSSLIAWAILMFFALLGKPMLHALGISLASFRIAGGIMLFFIALDMVFERRTERREKRAEAIEGTPEAEDISVFPMAIPMITGPGSIASAMLWVSRAEDVTQVAVVLGAITTVMLITLLTLLAAGPLMKLIGEKLEAMITRILGVILAALAAQFVIDGLKQSFPNVLA